MINGPDFAGIPPAAMPSPPPAWLLRAVLGLRAVLLKLVNVITPPELQVLERATGVAFTMTTAQFAKHYVHLLDRGPITAAQMARELNRDPDATFRFMHFMASVGFVAMLPDGRFEHNKVSRVLRRDHRSRTAAFAEYFASASNVRSWLDLDATLSTGKNAFARTHGVSVWEWFDRHPEERAQFAEAMMGRRSAMRRSWRRPIRSPRCRSSVMSAAAAAHLRRSCSFATRTCAQSSSTTPACLPMPGVCSSTAGLPIARR
jgi:hypothetical protein